MSKDVDKILAAGNKAPTGCNYQPQRILVLNTEQAMDKLHKCTKSHFNAPAAMLVCYNEDESRYISLKLSG
ncbi:MAG: nitroreductase family protein [Oscillospiraceae bacterium]|nr:nitroreductase family protein [Oscillospiraceae bacterium]